MNPSVFEFLELGEATHGSPQESKILDTISHGFPEHTVVNITTKYWEVNSSAVYVNGERLEGVVMPYTKGCVKGKIGREIGLFQMPSHPFLLKSLPLSQYEGVLIYEEGKLRKIVLPQGSPPSFFIPRKVEGIAEICSENELVTVSSRNVEVKVRDGDSYILFLAHVDHWLTGFHDNLFSVGLLMDLKKDLEKLNLKHGVKIVFLSSEEGPRCCTGSMQYPTKDVFSVISIDATYPSRVVYSSTPDLWSLSSHFNLKRVEMPTPFSDHFPFVAKGIPGLVLYNDDMIGVYHSNTDLPIPSDDGYYKELKSSLIKFTLELDSKTKEELDEKFFEVARQRGYRGDVRDGALVPDPETLLTKFRVESS
ncbi:M28 family peptidase [Metallosphaera tengchongensis]|uniref:M28 family peptidase n=1 Tax=Metallosphaera tengchongensis TaxID=1532350 RepID=A0A6N0NQW2_9CREN|nr:M28 family peptidase [Metallosphaera tengchongensis]QKQ99115.1 M28 family peptidase [Metallosphaera tengchongensis]